MNNEEAEALLLKLGKHYGCPVMPINKYCDGLRTWQKALIERSERLAKELRELKEADVSEADKKFKIYGLNNYIERYEKDLEHIRHTFLMIRKSNLLDRLLYCGESLRKEMCPEHKGHWTGGLANVDTCEYGCQLTGWIKEEANV